MTAGLTVIAALMALVLVHELGHFLAARAVGIRATKFSLFFGPAIWSRKIGETEYRLGTIPLGGYVSLPGMFPPTGTDASGRLTHLVRDLALGVESQDDREALLTALQRIESAADPDELGARLAVLLEELQTVRGLNPAMAHATLTRADWERRADRAIRQVRSILDDCHKRAYWRADLWRRMVVIVAGPIANIIVAFVVLTGVLTLLHPVLRYSIANVEKDSPAARAGLEEGGRIVAWNGVPASKGFEAVQEAIQDGRGKPVTLKIRSEDGEVTTQRIVPERLASDVKRAEKAAAKAGEGAEVAAVPKRIGVNFELERVAWTRRNPVSAAGDSLRFMWQITVGQLKGVARVVVPEGRREISSVVGIVKIAPEVERRDNLITYIAVISMALAVLNLLPILPLDGGHLAFGLIEFLRRGRPLPRRAFERYSMVGITFVLMLFFIGLGNDVGLTK